jgi:hypothetical protein
VANRQEVLMRRDLAFALRFPWISAVLLALAGLAAAWPAAAQSEVPVPPADVAAAATPSAAAEDRFDVAVRLLVEGNALKAEEILREVAADPADAQRASLARSLLGRLERARLAKEKATAKSDRQEGRTALLATSTAAGLILYGTGVPEVLGINDTRATVGLYMVTAGGSFLLPYFVTADMPVSWGMSNMAFHGATRGAGHGVLLTNLISDNVDGDMAIAAAMSGSVLEMVTGAWYAHSAHLSAGEGHLMGVGADFGLAYGSAFASTAAWDSSGSGFRRVVSGSALAGTALGFVAAEVYRGQRHVTWGDAEFMRTTGLLGAFAGLNVADWTGMMDAQSSERYVPATIAIGSLASLALGDYLGKDEDFAVGESLLIDLGSVTGGLLAAGLTYLVGDFSDETPYFTAGLVGAATGYGLSYVAQAAPGVKRSALWIEQQFRGLPLPQLAPWAGADGARGVALGARF